MKSTSLSSDELDLNPRSAKRAGRADKLRKQALSPVRILTMVLALPITTGMIALGVYLRTTDYEPAEAIVHIVALAGCDAAGAIGVGPVRQGEPGYHRRNDPDGDGLACETGMMLQPQSVTTTTAQAPKERMIGGAKFVRP